MPLEYQKDGRTVRCKEIRSNGHVGQTIVLASVKFGDKDVLARYPQPCVFTIIEKFDEPNGSYVLADSEGQLITTNFRWFYDANEYLAWEMGRTKEKLSRKNCRIKVVEAHLALLRDILIKQGIRVVTQEQANALGIT